MHEQAAVLAALKWQMEIGADVALAEQPCDRLARPPAPPPSVSPPVASATTTAQPSPSSPSRLGTAEAVIAARQLAEQCQNLADLREAIRNFDGFAVKATATQMVFADGDSASPLMLIGEAPGADEDRQGLPFVGKAGQLLNRMLAAIALQREDVYISNILNWRPPGNRTPTPQEMDIARPLILRHIELAQPKLLVIMGNVACKTLLQTEQGITRLRGKMQEHDLGTSQSWACLPTFHPSYLLRNPTAKRSAWADMLKIQAWLTKERE